MEEYKKDFDGWNEVKKGLNAGHSGCSFREGEVWWCSTGVNIGSEQDGKGKKFERPVLVLKVVNSRVFICIPITSKSKIDKTHIPFYFEYDFHTALVSQIRVYDRKRLIKRKGVVSTYLLMKMKKAAATYILS